MRGILGTTARARTKVYWPGVNRDIEHKVKIMSPVSNYRAAERNAPAQETMGRF